VLFTRVGAVHAGVAHLLVPRLATLDVRMLALVVASGIMLLRLRWSVHRVLAAAAALSFLIGGFAR